jgi:large subunit ribosomal protein L21e
MGTNGNQKSKGTRARTRDLFSKPFKKKGAPNLTRYLKIYKLGDIIDIKCDPSVHSGMPFKYYQGKTGRVWNVTPRAVGVFVSKKVGHRFLLKKIHLRVEHVSHSTSRDDFLNRMKRNDEAKRVAKAKGGKHPDPAPPLARASAQPATRSILPLARFCDWNRSRNFRMVFSDSTRSAISADPTVSVAGVGVGAGCRTGRFLAIIPCKVATTLP